MAEVVAVANPSAAHGRAGRYVRRLRRLFAGAGIECAFRFTAKSRDATRLTQQAIVAGASTVLAIGGDGTVNEVVNGFFENDRSLAPDIALALAPVGTGTDFAKTLRQTSEPEAVLARLRAGRTRRIDVGRVETPDLAGRPIVRHFVNIAEFGSGGAVVEKVNRTTKVFGGKVSFLLGILSTMPKYRNKRVRYRVDGGAEAEVVANNFIVANGRYFGGGLMPAPRAELDDGMFDVVVIGDLDWKTIRRHIKDLRRGTHLDIPGVTFVRGREVRTVCRERALLDLDGELVGCDPTRFVCLPRALELVV